MPEQDKHSLMEFLDSVRNKGLMSQNAANSMKYACGTVFSILDDNEDIFAIDLDALCDRFENLKGMEVTPNTMRAYRQRAKRAVSDFRRYKDDPSHWKPSGGRLVSTSNKKSRNSKPNAHAEPTPAQALTAIKNEPTTVDDIVHRFPLRRAVIVQITGIPFDVTRSEMGRMNAFLSNLVAVSADSEPVQLMLNAPDAEAD